MAGRGSGSGWVPLPAEVAPPPAAPDDPAAYRGVRVEFRRAKSWEVVAGGRPMPWLELRGGAVTNATMTEEGPYFGRHDVFDGRHRMVWFTRLLEAPQSPPPPADDPENPYDNPAGPPRELRPEDIPEEPVQAVLDVLVLPSGPPASLSDGCGGAEIVAWRDRSDGRPLAAWRFDRSTGRISPTDTAEAACPDGDD